MRVAPINRSHNEGGAPLATIKVDHATRGVHAKVDGAWVYRHCKLMEKLLSSTGEA